MSKKPKNLSSDLQGISQLSIDAVKETTKLVESLHSTISQFTPIIGNPKEKTSGVTRVVYKSINAITHLLGEGINAVLNTTSQMQSDYAGNHQLTFKREAIASAMNGVLGNHIDKRKNPLAINMSFRVNGQSLGKNQLLELCANTEKPITILIHGLCMNDLQWTREGHNHGDLLEKDLDHTVIYLHYNTGLHVSENGKKLSNLLNRIEIKPEQKINLLCHSMGGLVARSSCYYAQQLNHNWIKSLDKMVFLGTPHHGAILAKGGHWVDVFLQISPYSAPFAKITRVRSNGLHDLRHGYVIDDDWQSDEDRKIVPIPNHVRTFAIATTTSEKDQSNIANNIIGDGLVSINSALGIHKDKQLDLNIIEKNQWIGRNISHMQLLSDVKVYEKIKHFLSRK